MQKHRVIKEWPGRYFDFPWALTGDGHFWMASFNKPGTEIDPATGRFLRQFFPPDGADLALPRGDSMWFTTPSGLVRYDLRVHQESPVVAKYRIVHGTHRFGLVGIAYGAGSLWVASHEENEVVRVDPANGRVLARIRVRLPVWLAFGDGSLWTTSDVDGVERIDPKTNTVAAFARVPEPIDEVRVGGGFAWATNAPKGVVYKIDPSGQVAATYATGDGAHEPSFSAGKLWVSNADAGTLTSIDAASGETRTYRFGHPLGTEAVSRSLRHRRDPQRRDGRGPAREAARERREADRPDLPVRPARPAAQHEPVRPPARARDLRRAPPFLAGDRRGSSPTLRRRCRPSRRTSGRTPSRSGRGCGSRRPRERR